MGKVMRHTLGASLNIRHNLSSSKGPKPLQLKLRSEERRVGKEGTVLWWRAAWARKGAEWGEGWGRRRRLLLLEQKTAYEVGLSIPAEPRFRSITGVVEMVIRRPL